MSDISSAGFIVISTILTTIVVGTFVGNLFVITAILIDKNLQTTANQLVLSLAVADLMVACLVMPLGAYNDLHQGWYLGKEICEFWTSADVLCCTASILNLLAIALDRYWAVTNVDYIYRRTRRRVNTMILCVWTVGAIVSLAPIFGWKDPGFSDRVLVEHKCMVSQDVAYQVFATISTFYAPLVVLLALYWRIFQVARKRIRRKPGQDRHPATAICGGGENVAASSSAGKLLGESGHSAGANCRNQGELSTEGEMAAQTVVGRKLDLGRRPQENHCGSPGGQVNEVREQVRRFPGAGNPLIAAKPPRAAAANNSNSSYNYSNSNYSLLNSLGGDKGAAQIIQASRRVEENPNWAQHSTWPPQPSEPTIKPEISDNTNDKTMGSEENSGLVSGASLPPSVGASQQPPSRENSARGQRPAARWPAAATEALLAAADKCDPLAAGQEVDSGQVRWASGPHRDNSNNNQTFLPRFSQMGSAEIRGSFGRRPASRDLDSNEPHRSGAQPRAASSNSEAQQASRRGSQVEGSQPTVRLTGNSDLGGGAAKTTDRESLICEPPPPVGGEYPASPAESVQPEVRLAGHAVSGRTQPPGRASLASRRELEQAAARRRVCAALGCTMEPEGGGCSAAAPDAKPPTARQEDCDSMKQEQLATTKMNDNKNNESPAWGSKNFLQLEASSLAGLAELGSPRASSGLQLNSAAGLTDETARRAEAESQRPRKAPVEGSAPTGEVDGSVGGGAGRRVLGRGASSLLKQNPPRSHLGQSQRTLSAALGKSGGDCCCCCCQNTCSNGANRQVPPAARLAPCCQCFVGRKLPRIDLEPGQRGEQQFCARSLGPNPVGTASNGCCAMKKHAAGDSCDARSFQLPPTASCRRLDTVGSSGSRHKSSDLNDDYTETRYNPNDSVSFSSTSSASSSDSSNNSLDSSSQSYSPGYATPAAIKAGDHTGAQVAARCPYLADRNPNHHFGEDNDETCGNIMSPDDESNDSADLHAPDYDDEEEQSLASLSAAFPPPIELLAKAAPPAVGSPVGKSTQGDASTRLGQLGGSRFGLAQVRGADEPEVAEANRWLSGQLSGQLSGAASLGAPNGSGRRPPEMSGDEPSPARAQAARRGQRVWPEVGAGQPEGELSSGCQAPGRQVRGGQLEATCSVRLARDEYRDSLGGRCVGSGPKDRGGQPKVGHRSLDIGRKFRALGQLVSFIQTSRNFNSSSSAPESSQSEEDGNSCQCTSKQASGTTTDTYACGGELGHEAGSSLHHVAPGFRIAARQVALVGGLIRAQRLASKPRAGPDKSANTRYQVGSSPLGAHCRETADGRRLPSTSSSSNSQSHQQQVVATTTARRTPAAMASLGPAPSATRRRANLDMKREKKAAKTLAIITGVFVCCWLPFFVNAIIMPICGPSCTPSDLILSVLLWLGYLNSLLNPIIYTIFSPDFRLAFRRLLC